MAVILLKFIPIKIIKSVVSLVVQSKSQMKFNIPPRHIIVLINGVTSFVEGVLGLRLVLKLFGALTVAPFVRWVYETTDPLLTPFSGMFPAPKITGGFVIEFSTLFALIIFATVGYLATELVESLVNLKKRQPKLKGQEE